MGLHNPASELQIPYVSKYDYKSSKLHKSRRKLSSLCCLGTVLSAQQRCFVPDQETLPHAHALSFGQLRHTPSPAEEIQGRIDSNLGQADSHKLPNSIQETQEHRMC